MSDTTPTDEQISQLQQVLGETRGNRWGGMTRSI